MGHVARAAPQISFLHCVVLTRLCSHFFPKVPGDIPCMTSLMPCVVEKLDSNGATIFPMSCSRCVSNFGV
jgi:hypothetical protein